MLDLAKVRQILVIKLRYIGDVLLCTPAIESLKKSFPEASITVMVNAGTEEILRRNPYLDHVVALPQNKEWRSQMDLIRGLRSKRFDLALDLTDGDRSAILGFLSGASYRVGFNSEHRWRGILYHQVIEADRQGMHAVDYHLEMVQAMGCKVDHQGPRLYPSDQDRLVVERALFEKGLPVNGPFIVMHPGSRWWFKSWPSERFINLAEQLHETLGYSVVMVGGSKDMRAAEEIVSACGSWVKTLAGQISVLQLAALVQRAALFVGNDAGPMHIAAAMGTPVVALFGPTDPRVWGPWGIGHEVIWKQMDCNPCWQSDCQRGELNCMRQITVDEVRHAVTKTLKKKP
jgi:predicted lipopolysaccharide heptosyltransferase III